jgi:hypothetical protein
LWFATGSMRLGVSGPLSLSASAQQSRDRADKAVGRLDRRGGLLQRHYRVWTCLVVSDRLKLVSLRKKVAQIRINSGLVCNQPEKLFVDAPMGLGRSVGLLKDQGLSGMKGAEISGSAGFFAEIDGEDGSSMGERLARLVKYRSASGFTDRCLRGGSRASAASALGTTRRGMASRE